MGEIALPESFGWRIHRKRKDRELFIRSPVHHADVDPLNSTNPKAAASSAESEFNPDDYTTEQSFNSADGTRVPMFISPKRNET